MKNLSGVFSLSIFFIILNLNAQSKDSGLKFAPPPTTIQELKDRTFYKYVEDIDVKDNSSTRYSYSNSMMNLLFTNEIQSFATNTKDVVFENFFLTLDSKTNSLSLGKSYNLSNLFPKKDKFSIPKLSSIGTIYVRASEKDGYSKILIKDDLKDEYELNSNIGIGLKYTYYARGSVYSFQDQKTAMKEIRNRIVKGKIQKDIEKYLQQDFALEKEYLVIQNEIELLKSQKETNQLIKKQAIENIGENPKKLIEKKYKEFYQQISKYEVEIFKKNKLFNFYTTHWFGVELFLPVTKQEINVAPDIETNFNKQDFSSWKASLSGNKIWSFSKGASFNLGGVYSIFNNNNFNATNSSTKTYQSISGDNENFKIVGTANKVYIGEFEDFTSSSLKVGGSFLIFNNSIGLSSEIEQVFGKYSRANWKFGIPFSLKDKEGKPTVNFELQWTETFGLHQIGLSIGYVFGKFLK